MVNNCCFETAVDNSYSVLSGDCIMIQDHKDMSVEEARYASEVPINQRRYLCDCRRCIGHALELENVDNPYGVPSEFELRFVTLPGPKLTLSNDPLRRQLMDLYHRRPELSLTVCGCRYCTLHRNLAKAWLQVWQS